MRSDTKEYFENVASERQSANAADIAAEALVVFKRYEDRIAELENIPERLSRTEVRV